MNHAFTVIHSIGGGGSLSVSTKLLGAVRTPLQSIHRLLSSGVYHDLTPSCLLSNGLKTRCIARAYPSPSKNSSGLLQTFQRASDHRNGANKLLSRGRSLRFYAERTSRYGTLSEKEYLSSRHRFHDLSLSQLEDVIGPGVKKKTGNALLTALQKQRLTGTLDQGVDIPGVTPEMSAKALLWLREVYSFDEDAAIMKRIEHEESTKEKRFIAEAGKWHPQQSAAKDGLYGQPVVDQLAQEVRETRSARQRQAEEIRKISNDTTIAQNPRSQAVSTGTTGSAEWVKRYKERAMITKSLEPADISKTRRLVPCAIFAASIIALCFYFAANYKPPSKEARLFPDDPPARTTILTLMAINIGVFLAWRVPLLWRFMNKNFLLVPAYPFVMSLLGSNFSHQAPGHLFANMAWLWFLGLMGKIRKYSIESCL